MIDVRMSLGSRSSADVSPGLFGALVEHFGRGLYGGVWDSAAGHPRSDVLAAVRGMGVTNLRYPGGCFSDSYHWRDGIGDPARRPTYERTWWTGFQVPSGEPDLALAEQFGPRETNAVGTDEFLRYCNDVGAEPLLAANFGTGTPEEAAEWVAYTNTRAESPRPVRWWFVGNETYNEWEPGHCTPTEYGRRFRDFAAAMKEVDPDIRLIAVGDKPRGEDEPWTPAVVAAAGDAVDMVSLHYYFPGYSIGRDFEDSEEELHQLLRGTRHLGKTLDDTLAAIDPLPLALDEWSLWSAWPDLIHRNHRLCDSVFFGGCFNRMIERADRVRFAMISHLVNCMAPIQTDENGRMYATAAYLTFRLYRASVRSHPVPLEVDAPAVDVQPMRAQTGDLALGGARGTTMRVPLIDAVATGDARATAVLVCAGTLDGPIRATIDGLPPRATGRARWIDGPSPFARNDFDAPARLGFAQAACASDARGRCRIDLRPATLTALVFDHEEAG
jgi:alpha-N-arabinofuranosidase